MFFTLLYKILDWYCDVWIITDRGITDVRWSLFMQDTTFTEFHDISAIHAHQGSLMDKMFNIGDITLHKMGDELYVSRMYQPDSIVAMIQSNLYQHHEAPHTPEKDMHIYLDGVRQNHVAVPYKSGFRYMPSEADDEKFIEKVRQQPGVIDLSGVSEDIEEKKHSHLDSKLKHS